MRTALRNYWEKLTTPLLSPQSVRVVALGHQKSGTTAIAALIAEAAGVALAFDPLFHIDDGRADVADRLSKDPSSLSALVQSHKRSFCRPVLKDPDLSFFVTEAMAVFSHARFLFVMRDPRTTIRSIADRLGLAAHDLAAPADASKLPNRHWQLILSGALPEIRGRSVAEVLARRWLLCAENYAKNSQTLTLVSYERFLEDKSGVIHRTMEELKLQVRRDIADKVNIAFQPRGNARAPLPERLGRENLRVINEICGQKMTSFGYL